MASTSTVTEVTGVSTHAKASQELRARRLALGGWEKVSKILRNGAFTRGYLWQVANGQKPPSRRLLLALGIVKPEKRTGIRVRMSKDEAMALVRGQVSLALENRIRYQLWGRK